MAQDLTDLQLLHELEPVVETNINRHMSMRKDWNPHDYIPWSDGKNYYALGGRDWAPDKSKLPEVTRGSFWNTLVPGEKFAESPFRSVIYVPFQGLATRVSHRNTGRACNETIADQLLQRVSADENLHLTLYLADSAAGSAVAPNAPCP